MLALPVVHGSMPLEEDLFSIGCTISRWQNRCKDEDSSDLTLRTNIEGALMLRVQTQKLDGTTLICRLEGRFTREGADEVRRLVTRCESNLEFVVDLTDVLFIDATGEEVLLFVKRLGAQFVAETAYSRDICERLQLPLLDAHKRTARVSSYPGGNGHRPA